MSSDVPFSSCSPVLCSIHLIYVLSTDNFSQDMGHEEDVMDGQGKTSNIQVCVTSAIDSQVMAAKICVKALLKTV